MSASLGTRFLSAISGGDSNTWFQYGGRLAPLFEDDPQAQQAFVFVDTFAKKNGKVPTLSTIQEATGLMLTQEPSDAEFLFDQLMDRRIKRQLALTGQDVQKLLAVKPREALALMHKATAQMAVELKTPQTYDFKASVHTLWPWLVAKWTGEIQSVPFPWHTLQAMSNGTYGGEVVSIVARTGLGKTWLMLEMALHIWRTTKRPVVFVTLEIMARGVLERLAAMFTQTPMDQLKHALSPNYFSKKDYKLEMHGKLLKLEASDMPPFIVVDGNLAAMVEDVCSACYRYDPIAVFIDGAYMLKHPNPRLAKHEKNTENIEAIKRDLAMSMDLAAFTSWQFNRDATKLKVGEVPGPEHVGGGDGVPNTSSVLLGIFQGDQSDNAAQISKRRINILKGRGGERGQFDVQWDFARMDFGEVSEFTAPTVYGIELEGLELPFDA